MWPSLLLAAGLCLGDTPSPSNGEEPPPEKKPSDESGPLMKLLAQTCAGPFFDRSKVKVSGWADVDFTGSSASHDNLPLGFNHRANEYHLQQGWLRIERAADEEADHATFGFRSDTFAGIDHRFTIARGLFDSQLTANQGEPATYGADPVQFYGIGYFPHVAKGLEVKVGRFFAQYGQEVIDTTQNALASHSHTFIYNPFTHTGLLTTLKLSDDWSVQNGITTGCDVFIDPAATPTYLGSVKWAPPQGNSSALFAVILCSGRFDQQENFHNPQIFDLLLTHKLNDKLTYALEGLYGFTDNVPDIGFANWYGLVNYLTWNATDKISTTARLEFFDDAQGQRTGFEGLYNSVTLGVTYKPCKALSFRPEVRYDYNPDSRPFEGKRGLFTATVDVLLKW